jgi:serine/threonine protein kinase
MESSDLPELDEKFELLGKLGEGGMGAIYKVRHRLLDQVLVVKMMTPRSASSAELQKRFLREAQTATRLRHPGIVSITDFVLRADGSAYMVMEYLEGANLADAVRRCGRMPASLVLFIADQVLSALGYMHEKGAIHRDIAPDNIMLTREETGFVRAKLIDLGIAKILDAGEELTVMHQFIGKLRYASPEQLAPREARGVIDGRTDIYSLGAAMYELLTGVKAFRGDNILALFHAHQTGTIVPFDESDPKGELSPELRAVLLRAMAVNPDDRFATAADFRQALASLLPGNPLGDPAVRSYIQAILSLSAEEFVSFEDRHRSGSGLSPGGTRPRSTPAGTRPTSGGLTAGMLSSESPVEEPTVRTPSAQPPSPTSAPTASLWKEEPATAATMPRSGEAARPSIPPVGEEREPAGVSAAATPPVEARRMPRLATVALPVGLVVVVGIALLLWLRRPREEAPRIAEPPVATPVPTAFVAAKATVAALPSPPPPIPTAVPTPERRAPTKAPAAVPTPKPTLVAQIREIPTAIAPVRATRPTLGGPVAPPIRFCPLIEPTYYQQGVVKERPKGFAADSREFFRRARDDAGRIQIRLTITPKEPAEGQTFLIVGDVINGGDLGLVIEKIEESSVAAAGGFRPVAGPSLPLEIPSGGAARIFTYQGVVSGRSPFSKELRITDSRTDSWKTSVRFRPCPES